MICFRRIRTILFHLFRLLPRHAPDRGGGVRQAAHEAAGPFAGWGRRHPVQIASVPPPRSPTAAGRVRRSLPAPGAVRESAPVGRTATATGPPAAARPAGPTGVARAGGGVSIRAPRAKARTAGEGVVFVAGAEAGRRPLPARNRRTRSGEADTGRGDRRGEDAQAAAVAARRLRVEAVPALVRPDPCRGRKQAAGIGPVTEVTDRVGPHPIETGFSRCASPTARAAVSEARKAASAATAASAAAARPRRNTAGSGGGRPTAAGSPGTVAIPAAPGYR